MQSVLAGLVIMKDTDSSLKNLVTGNKIDGNKALAQANIRKDSKSGAFTPGFGFSHLTAEHFAQCSVEYRGKPMNYMKMGIWTCRLWNVLQNR